MTLRTARVTDGHSAKQTIVIPLVYIAVCWCENNVSDIELDIR